MTEVAFREVRMVRLADLRKAAVIGWLWASRATLHHIIGCSHRCSSILAVMNAPTHCAAGLIFAGAQAIPWMDRTLMIGRPDAARSADHLTRPTILHIYEHQHTRPNGICNSVTPLL